MSFDVAEYQQTIQRIHAWPVADQLRLVQVILNTLEPQPASTRGVPSSHMLGLAAGGGPVPDDATVEQWKQEHLREKYG